MSTSRDFRINAASLLVAMEQAAAADEESGDSDASADSDKQVISLSPFTGSVSSHLVFMMLM